MKLEARGMTFYYPGKRKRPVLQGVSLSIAPGERVGLQAPSGSGKTTLCRLMAGYEKPQQGEILLDGRPLQDYRGVCPVQMVWQHPETVVDPLLRLGDTLSEAGAVEERLAQALHIEQAWRNRYPAELSGGELQRFCIARALRPETRFLLCDEISAMLDLVTQAQITALPAGGSRAQAAGVAGRQPRQRAAAAGVHAGTPLIRPHGRRIAST